MERSRFRNLAVPVLTIGAFAGMGAVAAWALGMPLIAGAIILPASILANGFIATIEDDLPGGFNNPNGDATPKYASLAQRIWKIVGYGFLGLVALGALTAAIARSDLSIKLRIASIGFGLCALFIAIAIRTEKRVYLLLSVMLLVTSFVIAAYQ